MNRPGLWDAVRGVVRRDLLLAMRRPSDVAMSVFFLVIVASLFPLGVGPESAVLRTIAAGVLWVAALLPVCCRWDGSLRPISWMGCWSRWC